MFLGFGGDVSLAKCKLVCELWVRVCGLWCDLGMSVCLLGCRLKVRLSGLW